MNDPIVIVSAARTPIGGLLGDFSSLQAHQLGAVAIKAAVERAGIAGDAVDEVLMGNCLMAGQGQAPARQAVLGAGLPQSAGAVTLSKMCGSGMRAMMFAHDMLRGRQRRRGRRRRHGEHDQRAAPDGQRAQGLSLRRRDDVRPHGARRPGRRLSSAARRWACSPKTASPSTASRASRRTSSRSPRPSARTRPTTTAASTGRSRR